MSGRLRASPALGPSRVMRVGSEVRVTVPAKINLSLSVGPRRPDGYHDIATVFHAVGLYDDVTVTSAPAGSGVTVRMVGDATEQLPTDDDNIAVRAVRLAAARAGRSDDVHVAITKAIPIAGGMAGGSADAAAVLAGCAALWTNSLDAVALHDLASQLGSDVPFLLEGGTMIGTGRGEILTPVLAQGGFHWVIAVSDTGLSTPAVYAELDRLRENREVSPPSVDDDLLRALRGGDARALGRCLHNDLQEAALSLRPSLARVLDAGSDLGALGGIVSGSGPTCVFLARDREHALDIAVGLTTTGLVRVVRHAASPVEGARVTAG